MIMSLSNKTISDSVMAKSPPKPPARLTPKEMSAGIARLQKRREEVERVDPLSVTDQNNTPTLNGLEAAVDEALVRTFGADTLDYQRYKSAAGFDRGPYNYAYKVPPQQFQASVARSKDSSLALLAQAIRSLKEQLEEHAAAHPQGRGPEAPQQGASNSRPMTDGELRHNLLAHFYRLRRSNGEYVPVDDMIIPVTGTGSVTLEAIGNVCRQLGEAGLIEWTGYIGQGRTIGRARITGSGVDVIERETSPNNETRFPSSNASTPRPSPVHDAPLPDAALTEIREAVSTVKIKLPALTLSNSARSEITADIGQIEIETERPTPRKPFLKISLESLRYNLAKAAGAAAGGFVATHTAILAKHFGLYRYMNHIAPLPSSAPLISALVVTAGNHAQTRFREFFAANIRNRHTRRAYAQAVREFLAWCERADVASIADVRPLHVAAYVEQLSRERSAPTVKQRLAAIRHLFDWLVDRPNHASEPGFVGARPVAQREARQDARARSVRSARVARQHRRDDADRASRPRPDRPHGLFVRPHRRGGRDEGRGRLCAEPTPLGSPARERRQAP